MELRFKRKNNFGNKIHTNYKKKSEKNLYVEIKCRKKNIKISELKK